MALWEASAKLNNAGKLFIPSDLLYLNTIPLMDCKIVVDERADGGEVTTARVKIFEDYRTILAQCPKKSSCVIGVIDFDATPGKVAIFIGTNHGENGLGFLPMLALRQEGKFVDVSHRYLGISQTGFTILETWYGIQIALLHPVVRDVFRNPRTVVEKIGTTKHKNPKKAKVTYVKEHVINEDELDRLTYGVSSKSNTRKRHALIWYVIGHWRTYKNGKSVFVQPHWKGALRDTRLADSREREIVLTQ